MRRPRNIPYLLGSIFGFCIVASITLSGVFRIVDPGTISTSSSLLELPEWVLLWLNVMWVVAGVGTCAGIFLARRRTEAAGLLLLATSYIAYFASIILFKGDSALSVLYVFGIAIGSLARAWFILSRRFVLVVVSR